MKRKLILATVFVLTAAFAVGCGKGNDESKNAASGSETKATTQATTQESTQTETETETKARTLEDKTVEELSPVSWEYDKSELKLATFGNDKLGYIQLPEDWFPDEDVAALTDEILAFENEPYMMEDRLAMDAAFMRSFSTSWVREHISDILYDADEDPDITEFASIVLDVDGKQGVAIFRKNETLHTITVDVFVTDDNDEVAYQVTIETSNPNIADLFKTYQRPKIE